MNLFAGFYDLPPEVRYRRAALAGAIVLMAYAAVQDASGPWDPLLWTTRALTICAWLALGVGARYSRWCTSHIGAVALIGATALLGHLGLAIYLHGLAMELVISALLASALIGLIMHTSRLLAMHLVLWSGVLVTVAMASPAAGQMNPVYFALTVGTESLFLYLIIGGTIAARENLRNGDLVMSAMFDHATDALMYGDTQSAELVRVNARARKLFETNQPTEIGELIKQAFYRANRPLTPEQALLDIPQGGTWQSTLPIRSAAGREFWADLTVSRILISGEDLMMIRISDTTEQVKTEANLRRQELLLDNAQSMARVAGWELDIRTRQMYWTNTMYDMFGFERGTDPPRDVPEVLADKSDYQRLRAAMERCTTDGIGFDLEAPIRVQGREMHIRYIAEPVFENGRLVRAVGVVSDISNRVRREAELNEAREAAEAAAKARSQFLANMSHEIRTPMNGVIGMTSLLLNSELSEEQQLQLETIRSSGESLLAILNEILDFSKIDANHVELEDHEFDLEQCIAEALEIITPAAAEKNLELSMEMRGEPQRVFSGDVMRLRQILMNLLSNAVKFTKAGEVSVSTRVTPLMMDLTEIAISIKDTGIGISPNQLKALFDPFVQADASTTRRFGGTGLGLSISKRLAELMSGTIEVESTVGVGSEFRVTMIMSAVGTAQDQGDDVYAELNGKRVLVADPRDTSRDQLIYLLRSRGMRVDSCDTRSWRDMLDSSNRYQLAIIDRRLLDDSDALSGTPLLALQPPGDLRASPACAAGTVRKPYRPSRLLNTIATVLSPDTATVPQPQQIVTSTSGPDLQPLEVLVAEDNAVNQKVAVQMLKKLGIEADVAGNGLEAVHMLSERRYDLVFMDVQMPELDGLEATRCIRITDDLPQPYIIAMTANVLADDRDACKAAGMDDFIPKPVRLHDVQDALDRARSARASDQG